ncbi:MAG: hypothetical protein ABIX01_10185 [Chitinophagaceae bacterium]
MRKIYLLLLTIFLVATAKSQVTVTVTNPANTTPALAASYTSLFDAVTALSGITAISGPVVLTCAAGAETSPAGGYVINFVAATSAANDVTITGTGVTITAPTPQASGILVDAIFKIIGSDFVTLQGFTMLENAANTTTAAGTNNMTEFGVALFYLTTTNGAQNNTIQNNTITLSKTYQNTFGIYCNASHSSTAIGTASATTTAGGNSGLKIYSNIINNVNNGIAVVGPIAAADFNNGIDIGGTSSATGNTISNYGTTGTFSGYNAVSGTLFGVLVRNSTTINVSYNSIVSPGTNTAGTMRAIYVPAFSVPPTGAFTNTFNNNTISLATGLVGGALQGITVETTTGTPTSTSNINNNNFTNASYNVASPTGVVTLILNSMANLITNINANSFSNLTANTTGSFTFISNSITVPVGGSQTISNNATGTAFSKTGAGGTVTGITSGGSSTLVTSTWANNTFSNITVTGATTLTVINNTDGSTVNHNIIGNTISNITGGTNAITAINSSFGGGDGGNGNLISGNTISGISSAGTIVGIQIGSSGTTSTLSGNTISGLSSSGASAVSGIISAAPVSCAIFKNKIYDLSGNNASSTVNGMLVSAGTLHNVYNNLVGNLTTPAANAAIPLAGINVTGGTTVNIRYNTVLISGTSSGALFGSAAIYGSSTPTLELRNNIFINLCTPVGATGFASAYRRSATTLTTYAAASNNNLFYAGTPGVNNLIFYDGTNSDQTLAAYKIRVSARDNSSVTENTTFASTTGSSSNFLHIAASTVTLAESGGANISGITDDFDADVRQGNPGYFGTGVNPDMGADEFDGTNPSLFAIDVSSNALVTPTAVQTCYTNSEVVTIKVKNSGTTSLNLATTNLTVNVNVTGAVVAALTATVNSGTLAAGATIDVPMSTTLNMTTLGPYTFDATSIIAGDMNAANDALSVSINRTAPLFLAPLISGSWNNPAIWCGGVIPVCTDSVVVTSGITLTANSAGLQCRGLTTLTGGTFVLASGDITIGCTQNNRILINNGTLTVNGGILTLNGSLLNVNGSSFNQAGGTIKVDGNDAGNLTTSVPAGTNIVSFGTANPGASLNLTGGSIVIVDPHAATTAASGTSNGHAFAYWGLGYRSGVGHTMQLGDGISTQVGGNTSGFQYNAWPGTGYFIAGNLVVDAVDPVVANKRMVTSNYSNGVEGNVEVISGHLQLTNLLKINGNINVNTGAFFTAPSTVEMAKWGSDLASSTSSVPSGNAQTISGSGTYRNLVTSATASLNTFIISNSSTAGITMNVPLSVSGTLTLTAGTVNTTAVNTLTLGISPASTGTLSRTSGFVKGPFRRYFAAATTAFGATASLLPVGGISAQSGLNVYYPAEIAFTGAPGAGGTLTAQFIPGSAGTAGLPQSDGAYSATDIYTEGYWKIDNTGITGGTYGVRLTGSDFASLQLWTAGGEARVIKRASGSGTWGAFEGTHTNGSSYTVQRDGLTTFSEFAITKSNVILPITLQYIKGVKTNAGNAVEWKVNCTSARINMEIERSADARNFSRLTSIAAEQVRCNLPFNFTDAQPVKAINYYRLKMIDMDGKVSYSAVIAIINADKGIEIVGMYPTAVHNSAFLSVAAAKAGKIQTVITDMSGKLIQSASQSVAEGSSLISVDCSALSAGVYHITGYIDGARSKTIRFIKL